MTPGDGDRRSDGPGDAHAPGDGRRHSDEPLERPERPRVVLAHGFTQSGASWRPVAAALSKDYEVVAPDLPGHGASPPATGDLSTAARQLADACGRATYVGYSMGGRICLHLALFMPQHVERLVLVSATAGIEDVDEREARRAADEQLAERIEEGGNEGVAGFIEEWLAGPLFADLDAKAADRASRLSNTATGLAGSLRHHGTGSQEPLWEQLGALEMPVLVVAGGRDAKFVDLGDRLAAAIGPNARFVAVEGAGHAVCFEQPERFALLLEAFLEAPAARSGRER